MILDKKHLNILVANHVREYADEKKNMQLLKELVEGCPIEFPSFADEPTSVGETGAGAGPSIEVSPAPEAPAGGDIAVPAAAYAEPAYKLESETDPTRGGDSDSSKEDKDVLGEPDVASDDELEGDDLDDEMDEMDLASIGSGVKLVQTVMTMF